MTQCTELRCTGDFRTHLILSPWHYKLDKLQTVSTTSRSFSVWCACQQSPDAFHQNSWRTAPAAPAILQANSYTNSFALTLIRTAFTAVLYLPSHSPRRQPQRCDRLTPPWHMKPSGQGMLLPTARGCRVLALSASSDLGRGMRPSVRKPSTPPVLVRLQNLPPGRASPCSRSKSGLRQGIYYNRTAVCLRLIQTYTVHAAAL